MKKFFLYFIFLAFSGFSAVNVKITGDRKVFMENEIFSITIDSQSGAQGVSFVNKKTGIELIPDKGKRGGLFIDHDFRQSWPGEFFRAKYNWKIVEKTANKVSVEFSYKVKGFWRKNKFPYIQGLIIKKKISIYSGKPFVDIEIKFYNPTEHGKDIIYWMQNIVNGSGNPEEDFFYRPSPAGVSIESGKSGVEWIYTPVEGWTGILNKKTKRGLVFLMDYNYLDTLYNCLGAHTTEWIYDYVTIPSKKEWKTKVRLVITNGFTDYTHASNNLIFGVELNNKEENKTGVEYQIQAVDKKIPLCKISTVYADLGEKPRMVYDTTLAKVIKVGGKIKTKDLGYYLLKNIGYKVVKRNFDIFDKNKGQKVLRISVEGDSFFEKFEKPFVTGKGIKPFYEISPPQKKKIILKPDVIKLKKNGKLDVLFIRSSVLVDKERWQIEKILKKANVKICPFYKVSWKEKGEVENFPVSYEEIMNFDVIILQGSIHSLGKIREEMIKDFVKAGGGLLITGGYFSYGKARIGEGPLSCIFPFTITSPFDLKRSFDGKIVVKNFPYSNLFNGEKPMVFWYHKIKPKEKSKVLLEVDGSPLLIEGTYGKGKILCFTGTVYGNPEKNTIPFWKWKNYKNFINKTVLYAAGGEL